MLNSIQNVKFIKVSKLNMFFTAVCVLLHITLNIVCVMSVRDWMKKKIKFFSTDIYFCLMAVLKGVLFRKPFACA